MDYQMPTQRNRNADGVIVEEIVMQKLRNSMLWMVWGLLTSAIMGYLVISDPSLMRFVYSKYTWIMFAELGVVFLFSARTMSASNTSLKVMFFIYSALSGLTITAIALRYAPDVVISAFIGTVAVFGGFAIVGTVLKRDLSKMGTYLFAALVGLIIASLAMMFLGASDFAVLVYSYISVILFAAFTAYDVNKIKNMVVAVVEEGGNDEVLEKVELIGALSLYLDFVNIFISMMRIFNRR